MFKQHFKVSSLVDFSVVIYLCVSIVFSRSVANQTHAMNKCLQKICIAVKIPVPVMMYSPRLMYRECIANNVCRACIWLVYVGSTG